jgi:hypothetical protein
MAEKPYVVELLKDPVVVLTILVALIVAKWTLGISFGAVAEINATGVKFAEGGGAVVAALDARLSGAEAQIEQLKEQLPERLGIVEGKPEKVEVFARQQTVSDQVAQITKFSSATGASPKQGYIWIGDFGDGRWDRAELGSVQTGQPVAEPPDQLRVGTEYKVLRNAIVRDDLPENNADYFRARKTIGTVSRGTRVRLTKGPFPIDRQYAVQYWAEIEPAAP